MGRADHGFVGDDERADGAVGVRPCRLGERAVLGAHPFAGQGSADRRSARLDAGSAGRRSSRARLPFDSAGSDHARAADGVPRGHQEQGPGPHRPGGRVSAGAGQPHPAGQASRRGAGARAVRSQRGRARPGQGARRPDTSAAAADVHGGNRPAHRSISRRQRRAHPDQRCAPRTRTDHRLRQPDVRPDAHRADRRHAERGFRTNRPHPGRRHTGRARNRHRQPDLPGGADAVQRGGGDRGHGQARRGDHDRRAPRFVAVGHRRHGQRRGLRRDDGGRADPESAWRAAPAHDSSGALERRGTGPARVEGLRGAGLRIVRVAKNRVRHARGVSQSR